MNKAIVWFRNDLRLHDNKVLTRAIQENDEVVCVYVFDSFWWSRDAFGNRKTGAFRTAFLLESVHNLRKNLQKLGSDLVVRFGATSTEFQALAKQFDFDAVYYQEGFAFEEDHVVTTLQQSFPSVTYHGIDGATLLEWEDLPFDSFHQFPNGFTSFRKKVESKSIEVKQPLPVPYSIPSLPAEMSAGEIPSMNEFGYENVSVDKRCVLPFAGGEDEAVARLNHYVWDTKKLGYYKKTRNGLLGADYSSKFSAWLAHGCISPKYIYQEVKQFEQEVVKNDSTYWLVFELLWRDFFHFIGRKHGNKLFFKQGIKSSPKSASQNLETYEKWRLGETGIPFIDANMKELLHTGFMSNRGRQNVASFLVKDLGIDWRMGAAWFEHQLLDYDVFSNYGNWNYQAGIGTDPRDDRWFNVIWQSKKYDPKGKYIRNWLPELKGLNETEIHQPYFMLGERASLFGLAEKYQTPIMIHSKW